MTDTPTATAVVVNPPARPSWKDWLPVATVLIAVVTVLLTTGRLLGQVGDNTRRITILEGRADRRDDQMSDLRERIGSIDAKLDLLVKRSGPEHR